MRDAGKKPPKGTFKKRAHRPWKSSLLETTIEETSDLDSSLFEFDINVDLDFSLEPTEDLDTFYPELDFRTEAISMATASTNTIAVTENSNAIAIITQPTPNDAIINNKLSLGGFFKTQQYTNENNLQATLQITNLLADLKLREQNAAIHEAKIRQAIEQTDIMEQQFNTALEQSHKTTQALQQEINLRHKLETQFKEAQLQVNNLQIKLQEEQQIRIQSQSESAELAAMRARVAYLEAELHNVNSEDFDNDANSLINNLQLQLQNQAQALSLAESEAQQTVAARSKMQYLEQKLKDAAEKYVNLELEKNALKNEYLQFKDHHQHCATVLDNLETKINEDSDAKLQHNKLKSIIAAEQQLRRIAEQQGHENAERLANAEKLLQTETQQRKVIEERAELAIEHANQTIKQLLNNKANIVLEAPVASTTAETIPTYDYEPDDLNY